jgi:hypothetical protein
MVGANVSLIVAFPGSIELAIAALGEWDEQMGTPVSIFKLTVKSTSFPPRHCTASRRYEM